MLVTVVVTFGASVLLLMIETNKAGDRSLLREVSIRTGALCLILACAAVVFVLLNPFLQRNSVDNLLKIAAHRDYIMQIQSATQIPAIHVLEDRVEAIYHYGILLGYDFLDLPGVWFAYMFILIAGMIVVGRRSFNELSCRRLGTYTILCIWMLTSFIFVGSQVHMRWERYFLPLVMCTTTVFALGGDKLLTILETTVFGSQDSSVSSRQTA
jgi:hypothetical protein